jgi:polyisoprenoid-binding protein YceI
MNPGAPAELVVPEEPLGLDARYAPAPRARPPIGFVGSAVADGTGRAQALIMDTHDEARRPGTRPRHHGADGELERWLIDPTRSVLRFSLRHLVIRQIRGQFRRWGGVLFLDRLEPFLSSVSVWIDLGSIETDEPERDEHVRSEEFLDVARFPRAEFKSDTVEIRDERVVIHGRLDLHGVVHDVDLEVEPLADSREPDGVERSRYRVKGSLDRQAFGLHWNQDLDIGGVVVGDDVEISADVEVLRLREDSPGVA